MANLNPVLDYNLIYSSTTGLFEKSIESIANPSLDDVVYNSYGIGVIADTAMNALLQTSAVDILADEIPFVVVNPEAEEVLDYTGGSIESVNQTVSAINTFGEYLSANNPDIDVIIRSEVIEMKLELVIQLVSPVIKTEYEPITVVEKDGIVTR